MNAYEAHQQRRRDRLKAKSARLANESETLIARALRVAQNLQGEPVKVGHHSEKPHRALLKRMDRDMQKGCAASKLADKCAQQAESVGTGGISSDDPDATAKLQREIEGAEESHAEMKAGNEAFRKCGKPAPDNADGWQKIADRLGVPLDSFDSVRSSMRRFNYRQPFPPFSLSNSSANIARMKKRIADLENAAKAETKETELPGGVRVVENVEANRLQLFFPGKPSDEMRAKLKQNGFKWAPSAGAWQRHLNGFARQAVRYVFGV